MRKLICLPILALLAGFTWYPSGSYTVAATDSAKVTIGTLVEDGLVTTALGVLVPITGDVNIDAAATLEYKEDSSGTWLKGMDLIRVDPQYGPTITSQTTGGVFPANPPSLAGIITGLTPDTLYDIRVTVSDPDGVASGTTVQTLEVATRAVPRANPTTPDTVNVTDVAGLETALSTAAPGDVITLAAGTYTLTTRLILRADGTEANPIFIRCADRATTIIDMDDTAIELLSLRSEWTTVENCTFKNASKGVWLYGETGNRWTQGIVIRGNIFENVEDAVSATGWGSDWIYIADNQLEGPRNAQDDLLYPKGYDAGFGRATGIEVAGTDIEIRNNTISAFVDSIGTSNLQHVATVGVFAHLNKILWGADDCLEFDFSSRNVAFYDNYCANAAAGISFQPSYDGPVYAFRNIVYNTVRGPIKINPELNSPHGMRVFHNTFIKAGLGWANSSGFPMYAFIVNNLFIGQGEVVATLHVTTQFDETTFDYNAWYEDLDLQFSGNNGQQYGDDFADWVRAGKPSGPPDFGDDGGNGIHDVLLAGETVFESVTLDFDVNDWTVWRDPDAVGLDFHLDASSSAINAAVVITGFNDGYGTAPDLGRFPDSSVSMPAHGVTW